MVGSNSTSIEVTPFSFLSATSESLFSVVITSVGQAVPVSIFFEVIASFSSFASITFCSVDMTSLDGLFSIVIVGSESTFVAATTSSSLADFVGL